MKSVLVILILTFLIFSTAAFAVPMSSNSSNNNRNPSCLSNDDKKHSSNLSTSVSDSDEYSDHQPPSPTTTTNNNNNNNNNNQERGILEKLKARETELSNLLAQIRRQKLATLRARPLTIGVVGFGRFGQFIARTFAKHGRVVVTSRSDYTEVADGMGVTYIPLDDPKRFMEEDLDVVVLAVSILSFEKTVKTLAPFVKKDLERREGGNGGGGSVVGPLFVDVLSVKEHPRKVLLENLPPNCDILCTHPMFGPDSGKNGWHGLNFIYEPTRIDRVVMDPEDSHSFHQLKETDSGDDDGLFKDIQGATHAIHENTDAHVEGMDRMERFLSIWEEEGCHMVRMSCKNHDAYAANSQFITHLMGRILGAQGLSKTPIDTKGFESVLKLIGTTTADSFDLFYGLYKYNQNSADTILKLQNALDDVVSGLRSMEEKDNTRPKHLSTQGNNS